MFCCSPQSAQSQSDITPVPVNIKKIVNTAEPARAAEPEPKKAGARFVPEAENDAGRSTEGENGGNREAMKSIYAAKTQARFELLTTQILSIRVYDRNISMPLGWAHASYLGRSWSQERGCS